MPAIPSKGKWVTMSDSTNQDLPLTWGEVYVAEQTPHCYRRNKKAQMLGRKSILPATEKVP